jgi:hypothetical protein
MPLVFASAKPFVSPSLVWWTTNALQKVHPYDREPEDPNKSVKISAARNEFEPFQVVLRAMGGNFDAVDVEWTDLRGAGNAVISKNHISVYLERFVHLSVPSSIDGGTGEWPDPLVPRVDSYVHERRNHFPFKLEHGRNQPLWFDLYVPRNTAGGIYEGQIHVSVSGKPKLNIPLQLEVWGFELPSTSSLVTTFGFSGVAALRQHFGRYTNDEQLRDLTFLYRKSGLWHRISLRGSVTVPPKYSIVGGHVRLQWDEFDKAAAPFMDGVAIQPNEPLYGAKVTAETLQTSPGLKTPEQQIEFWQQVTEHFRRKGWIDRLYNYLWDEPAPSDYPEMIALGNVVHRANAGVKSLVTAPLTEEWKGFVDIWTPTINCFERKESLDRDYCKTTVGRSGYDMEIAGGKKLWWYQACGTHGCNIVGGDYFTGWPTYVIDSEAIRSRIMEWLTWKYDIQGELYYSTTEAFGKKRDSWKDVHLFGGNGDGTLFYPGRPEVIGGRTDIPIESIRLKLIREGLEDYEYLTMLEKLSGRQKVMGYVDSIIRKTYDFDHDPAKLYAVRDLLGRELSRLSAIRN